MLVLLPLLVVVAHPRGRLLFPHLLMEDQTNPQKIIDLAYGISGKDWVEKIFAPLLQRWMRVLRINVMLIIKTRRVP